MTDELDKQIADYIQKWGDWTGVENYDLQIADLKSLIANQVREATRSARYNTFTNNGRMG